MDSKISFIPQQQGEDWAWLVVPSYELQAQGQLKPRVN